MAAARVTLGEGDSSVRWHVGIPGGEEEALARVRVTLDPARKRPAWLSVLALGEDRGVAVLCPEEHAYGEWIEPGVEESVLFRVNVTRIKGLSRPPRDRIIAVVTEQPANFTPFVQQPAMKEVSAFRGEGSGSLDGLPDLLLEALAPCLTRGADRAPPTRDEPFGVTAFDIVVVPESK